ncbi:MAG: amino acid adenylation domain-containing protein [Bacilli bacterium]|nr:amino acid adenylation domain-containing protein [Bacilli bacterium]
MKTNILDYIDQTQKQIENRIAVVEGDKEILFKKLYRDVKVLGCLLHNKVSGIIRKPIAVYLDKSIEVIASNIGIIYSGNAYMNLDTKTPIQRTNNILDLIQPALVITNNKYVERIDGIWDKSKILNIDLINFEEEKYCQDTLDKVRDTIIDTDPLCIINTSGSTGVPKGVVLNHRSFIDFTEWAIKATGIGKQEIVGSLSPIVFDIYSFELCMLMALGSKIVIIPDAWAAFPVKILELLRDQTVNFIFWVPTIMVNIANMDLLSRIDLSSLKMIWFAGEVFPTKQFNYWREKLTEAKFINLYGPIEITLDCTYYIVERELSDDEPIPIGYVCKNTDVLILNDDNQICEVNEEGELCVRGSSLAMGYYNNPKQTSEAFVQNPLNNSYPEIIYRTGDIAKVNELGEIMFLGRKDTLIKHLGYRIELAEIEHIIINTLKLVKNGCAVYNYDTKEIVFYYESDKEIAVAEMRKNIGSALPRYMIPNVFRKLDELPRNTNGKIDRLKLREMISDTN